MTLIRSHKRNNIKWLMGSTNFESKQINGRYVKENE